MSNKHRNYHNQWNQHHRQPENTNPVTPEVVENEVVVNDIVETPEVVTESVVEETSTEIIGIVSDCTALNVRKSPSSDAPVICEIKRSTEVVIDEGASTEDFYKVTTASGAEGFCMKTYISIQ